jgi:hypothetical protein
MKKVTYVMVVLGLLSLWKAGFSEEDKYFFPKENPIFSLNLPSDWDVVSSMFPNSWREWTKDDVGDVGAVPFQASPDFTQEGRLLITLWAYVPEAIPDLTVAEQKAGELIGERIKDFTPAVDSWESKSINGIPFIFMRGEGREKAKNDALVRVSAAFFNPEGTHVFLIMVSGSPEKVKEHVEEVRELLNSIRPGK